MRGEIEEKSTPVSEEATQISPEEPIIEMSESLTPLSLPSLVESTDAQVRVVLGDLEVGGDNAVSCGAPVALSDKLADPIRVEVDGRVVAWGEAVVMDGKIAVRILEIASLHTAEQEATS